MIVVAAESLAEEIMDFISNELELPAEKLWEPLLKLIESHKGETIVR
jgi:hypothetical protein